MNEFLKSIGQSKIPSLLLLGLTYSAGVTLLIHSGSNPAVIPAGDGLLILAGVLTILSAVDYRNKESIDHIIKHYKDALEFTSKINSSLEDKLLDDLKTREKKDEQYKVDSFKNMSDRIPL